DKHPINCIDHAQAAAYCAWIHGHLPAAAEWQWAAHGTTALTLYPWGNAEPPHRVCWSGEAKRHETCPVGAFPEGDSPDGLKDLSGNVREWTSTLAEHTTTEAYELGGASFAESVPNYFQWHSVRYFAKGTRSAEGGVRCAAARGSGGASAVASSPD